ncbi:hypothetical protein [Actinocrinis sp.]|uniref:hypothetical protein n=1 Tax=Actinocrinis sp. TaxID=1920516 RepID=UPI002DDD86D5|nr:hypothetical protein [Actinocrinis sp.]
MKREKRYVDGLANDVGWRSLKARIYWARILRPWFISRVQRSQTMKVVRYGRGGAQWRRACYVAS